MPKVIPAEHIDHWMWQAIYNDGSTLEEIEDDGTLHGYAEIDQNKLGGLILYPLIPGLPQFAVQLGNGRRLIFYRLRQRIGALGYVASDDIDIVHQHQGPSFQVIGFQRTVNDTNFKSLTYINEEGVSYVTDEDTLI